MQQTIQSQKKDKCILIKEYLIKVISAHKEITKRQVIKDLLNRLYAGNPDSESVIDDKTVGTEKTFAKIQRNRRLHSFGKFCSWIYEAEKCKRTCGHFLISKNLRLKFHKQECSKFRFKNFNAAWSQIW
jgi:hypothetical protein